MPVLSVYSQTFQLGRFISLQGPIFTFEWTLAETDQYIYQVLLYFR
jgi:hypothetical protein